MGQEEQPSPYAETDKRLIKGCTYILIGIGAVAVFAVVGYVALMALMFVGVMSGAERFNKEFPLNTAKLTGTQTLEVYAFHPDPSCVVLVNTNDQLEASEVLEQTTFELTQDMLMVGSYEFVPKLWWCNPDAVLDMPENTLEVTGQHIGGAEIGMRYQTMVFSEDADLHALLDEDDVVVVVISQFSKGAQALLIPESKIRWEKE